MSHSTHINASQYFFRHTTNISADGIRNTHTCDWVMAHKRMSHSYVCHDTQVNASWHTYEWVMGHKWMSHSTHMNASQNLSSHRAQYQPVPVIESRHTNEWVTTHIKNASWHTYEWVMARIWMIQTIFLHIAPNASADGIRNTHTCEWVMAHKSMHHGTHATALWHTHD